MSSIEATSSNSISTLLILLHWPIPTSTFSSSSSSWLFELEPWVPVLRPFTSLHSCYIYWIWQPPSTTTLTTSTTNSVTSTDLIQCVAQLYVHFLSLLHRTHANLQVPLSLLLHGYALPCPSIVSHLVSSSSLNRFALLIYTHTNTTTTSTSSSSNSLNFISKEERSNSLGDTFTMIPTPWTFDFSSLLFLSSFSSTPFVWKQYMNVVLGGTFDHLHEGHKLLLTTAGLLSQSTILCGLTHDSILSHKSFAFLLQSYELRHSYLKAFMNLAFPTLQFKIVPLFDPYGPSIHYPELDALVVTKETLPNANQINHLRQSSGLSTLTLILVPLISEFQSDVSSNPTLKLSSTRIREQHVNEFHTILKSTT